MSLTQEQIEIRRTGIGGSDIAAALGQSRWKSRLELYLEKIGEFQTKESEAMYWGTIHEPNIRQAYCDRERVSVETPELAFRHPSHEFLLYHADGVTSHDKVFEAKSSATTQGWGEPGSDDVPLEYLLQVQHGMYCTGYSEADIAVLFHGNKLEIYRVPADPELQEMMIDGAREFWQRVIDRNPPEPTTLNDFRLAWKKTTGAVRVVDAATTNLCAKLANIKAQIDILETQKAQLEEAIKGVVRDADAIQSESGDVLAAWKFTKAGEKFNIDLFKEENPETYEAYLEAGTPSRRFLLKVKA